MAHGESRAPIWRVVVATVALTFVLNSSLAKEKKCLFIGSTYQLVDNPHIEMTFFGDPKKRFDPFIAFAVSDSHDKLFSGYLGYSNGFPHNFLVSDNGDLLPKGAEKLLDGVDVTFLDENMNDIFEYSDGATYAIVDFARAMYFNGNPLLEMHKLTGIVWKLARCGS